MRSPKTLYRATSSSKTSPNHPICPKFPALINERMVNDYIHARIGQISNRTANHAITYIKQFLNFCVRNNMLGENPILNIRHFKVETAPPRFLTKPEIKAVLKASEGETLAPMIATALYTGMRLGELKRMTIADIDFDRVSLSSAAHAMQL